VPRPNCCIFEKGFISLDSYPRVGFPRPTQPTLKPLTLRCQRIGISSLISFTLTLLSLAAPAGAQIELSDESHPS
jgi:hypothetical protein